MCVIKREKNKKKLAEALSELAGVPLDRPASLNDIEAFEEALDIRVMVVINSLRVRVPTRDHASTSTWSTIVITI